MRPLIAVLALASLAACNAKETTLYLRCSGNGEPGSVYEGHTTRHLAIDLEKNIINFRNANGNWQRHCYGECRVEISDTDIIQYDEYKGVRSTLSINRLTGAYTDRTPNVDKASTYWIEGECEELEPPKTKPKF